MVSPAANRLRYFGSQALRSLRSSPLMHLVAVSTIAVSLLILGVFLTVLRNIDLLGTSWGQQVRVVAFLAADMDDTELESLAAEIRAWPEVDTVFHRTRDQAASELRDTLGSDGRLLDGVDPALIPASLEVSLVPEKQTKEALAAVAERLRASPSLGEVEDVDYGQDVLEWVAAARDLLRLGGIVVGGLVLFSVVFIVSNTVRLTLYARREEVEILQLVGATDNFIRGPYYVEGAAQGIAGGLLGATMLWFLYDFARERGVSGVSLLTVELQFLPTLLVTLLVAGSAGVAVAASHFAVGRFLRTRVD